MNANDNMNAQNLDDGLQIRYVLQSMKNSNQNPLNDLEAHINTMDAGNLTSAASEKNCKMRRITPLRFCRKAMIMLFNLIPQMHLLPS